MDLLLRLILITDTLLCNVLIDMYGKCGSNGSSVKFFEGMADRNIITWTVVITAHGLNGYAHKGLEKIQEMELTGLKPDTVALGAVLAACRHGGFVREGMEIFSQSLSIFIEYLWRSFLEGYKR
ncbi:hypothetical protein L6164_018630 [Bauhinia variegata]|uniref:Uncharacterized protein n=1 Tax=Bauhinia variegata TaxID=167791 RepID=A0ACB9NGM8_BAUVA|nr:hypothetical protein L6164_018630 [Bauhinia variegata]